MFKCLTSGTYFTERQVLDCEKECLEKLNWSMNPNSPLYYIRYMSTFGVLFTDDSSEGDELSKELAIKVAKYIVVFSDLVTYYPQLIIKYSDLELALACVICSRKRYKIYPNCSDTLLKLYGMGKVN